VSNTLIISLSGYLFFLVFAAYLVSAFLYIGRITLRRRDAKHFALADNLGAWGFRLAIAGVVFHLLAMCVRWWGSGHAPMSNMFEYMSFLGWSIMLFFVILSYWYKLPALGAFVAPVGVIVVAYASVFPTEVSPLVPALQSYWLVLHVTTAALGEGAFAVSFGAALMYLLRVRKDSADRWEESILEFVFYCFSLLIGFLITGLGFKLAGMTWDISLPNRIMHYGFPPVIGPKGAVSGMAKFAGVDLPIFLAPAWMQGANSGKNLNTILFTLVAGTVVYLLLRLIARNPLREMGSRAVAGMNINLLDEVSYRGVAVGFPLFTLGAIVFAMIWAQKAWGSYWSWDPKETWSLISWLFYSAYLHMRIVRGWEGKLAAWVAVIGFPLIIFTLLGVNLLISGLHSYAAG
jgi:cytochrome c-type biogenesis protein CcsB